MSKGKSAGNTAKKLMKNIFTQSDNKGSKELAKTLSPTRKLSKEATLEANKRLGNLYTGRKLNGKVIGGALIGGAVIANGGPDTIFGEQRVGSDGSSKMTLTNMGKITSPKLGNQPITYSQSPMTMGDGLVDEPRDMGANGAMVFGMHNKRHG